jgi:S-formylglutathione hydrolase FrmB
MRAARRGVGACIGLTFGIAMAFGPGASPAAAAVETVTGQTVGEVRYEVLLPPSYDSTRRRYPVLYVITGNGGDEDSATKALQLEDYAARDDAIIVTPAESQFNNLITDWADGSRLLDTQFVTKLIPEIDARYRTIPDRAHRAIAGYSAGGYSSMALAARHPELFVAAAAFSGVVDIRDRGPAGQATIEGPQTVFVDMAPGELFRRFGNPYTHPLSWAERNPTDLAGNLRGMDLYASAGDGIPADPDDAGDAVFLVPVIAENQIDSMTRHFVSVLGSKRIPITYRPHGGVHDTKYWREDMEIWWPQLMAAFGRRRPARFHYRSAAPKFRAWGWHFATAPERAPEFLDVKAASRKGLTLAGSGVVEVRTARIFRPKRVMRLNGATKRRVRAGRHGRLSFEVDLGPAHAAEEFTPAAEGQAPAAQTVKFRPKRSAH